MSTVNTNILPFKRPVGRPKIWTEAEKKTNWNTYMREYRRIHINKGKKPILTDYKVKFNNIMKKVQSLTRENVLLNHNSSNNKSLLKKNNELMQVVRQSITEIHYLHNKINILEIENTDLKRIVIIYKNI